jgi:hypothetical protein
MLIKARDRFAIPNSRLAGFDPSHVAGKNVFVSALSVGSNFLSLLNGARGTLVGTPTAPAYDSLIGRATAFTSAQATQFSSYTTTPAAVTFGAIIRTGALAGFDPLLSTGSNAAGFAFYASRSGDVAIDCFAGGTVHSGFGLVNNTAYFIVGSFDQTTTSWSFAVCNLLNGSIKSSKGSTNPTPTNTYNGLFNIGSFQGNQCQSTLAAAMHSTKFLSVNELLQWAEDPWSFWFPSSVSGGIDHGDLIVGAAAGIIAPSKAANFTMMGVG